MMRLLITGTVTRNAEIHSYGSKHIINFYLLHQRKNKNKEDGNNNKGEFIKASIWKEEGQSTKVAKYIQKGKRLLIEGDVTVDAYLGKDKEPHTTLSVNVDKLEFLN